MVIVSCTCPEEVHRLHAGMSLGKRAVLTSHITDRDTVCYSTFYWLLEEGP